MTKVKEYNLYWCDTCDDGKEMTFDQMIEHLTTVHGIDTKTKKCQKDTIMHVDGREYFSYVYRITFKDPDVLIHNERVQKRSEDDMMRHI